MGTPAQAADTSNPGDNQNEESNSTTDDQTVTVTFDQKVNQLLDSSETDEKGNIVLPEDIPEELKFASRAEKRRRDTQSALAKSNSANAILQAEKEGLTDIVKKGNVVRISSDEQEELDTLKFSDPDAWRIKMNEHEQKASSTLTSQLSDISEKAKLKGVTGERAVLLNAFQLDNPEFVINDDVLANDVPPRITRALDNGDISFIDFLGKVKEYVTTGKVVLDNKPVTSPNLSNIGGSDVPGEDAEKNQDNAQYEDQMF